MRVVFFGTPQFAVPTLQQLLDAPEVEVVAVVSQPDRRRGRGNQVSASPVKALAIAHDLPVWQPERLRRDPEVLSQLQQTQADAFVVVAYGQLLPAEVLAMPRLGCINVHGSLLPAYRGAAPIQWSLINGDRETGIVTMQMDVGMDTGPMLLRWTTPIALDDNSQSLGDRLATAGADLLLQTLRQLDQGQLTATPQNEAEATYARLLQKEDFQLSWDQSALELHNRIRGLYPGASLPVQGDRLKVLASLPLGLGLPLSAAYADWQDWQPDLAAQPGTVLAIAKSLGPIVATCEGALLLLQVQPAGRKPLSGWDWANGLRLQEGLSLLE
ncbi:methionyl-tRNA formyltransferase [Synechococcus elongatus]|uniref:methionyl-tRNA formyltransferase n=1 Tax=Synechococcus elongatus TaxID=32046 RepID=UPI000F7D6E4F|nr:methionyl-tRNA formyltransferase [Synechococcus elongatus]